ncbi:MAG TPA: hypothetical protein VF159_13140 [Gemmatimonadaceae bacterium]
MGQIFMKFSWRRAPLLVKEIIVAQDVRAFPDNWRVVRFCRASAVRCMIPRGPMEQALHPRRPTMMRHFRDEAGRLWTVFEVQPTGRLEFLPEAYRGGWLTFEHPSESRRLAPLPTAWKACSDGELAELLESSVKT